ncbi:tubulin-like doman-containing protein [Micromonospora sp. NBC_01796]|uniref:tubulin-like doman-containing protein n=1 Tax=Micromonospora sp. NBC_01796 TaxID=2975987 RepID=UPI002DDC7B06|nr:tubulin-like doman-containing protein [Micromonospora sp. NBC_01796]WSA83776.1 tubulin-like doman-containing protein [Micromonospora sp. NBC_01796]
MLPALVIGLGGTGSDAVAHLKHRLAIEQRWRDLQQDPAAVERSNGNRYDWPVLLRAVDVDRKNRPNVDGLTLDVDVEDLYLNSAVGGMIDKIRQGPEVAEEFYPTVAPWFGPRDAEQIREDEALAFMVEGAGQIRSFGRMSFFADVLGATPAMRRIEHALDQLTRTDADTTPNIYVVSSTAGGTGSGILLDVLAYLQQMRLVQGGGFSVTLFCVLSGAFGRTLEGPQRIRSEANGYALLRELDRVMNVERNNPAEFRWAPRHSHEMTAAPVQYTYLVDGRRGRSAPRRLEGFDAATVCPVAVADAIYAHLLPTVGTAFSSYRVNARPYTRNSTDIYSTFGAYLVEYHWESVLRGFVSRAGVDVLAQLPDRVTDLGAEVGKFLTGTDPEADGAQPPPVFKDLDSEAAREGLLSPTSGWLLAAGRNTELPDPPSLFAPFEDITQFRTDHRGQFVIDQTRARIRAFWGESGVRLAPNNEHQWYPVAEDHEREIRRQWEVALRLVVAQVMSRRDGGPLAGLAFVDLVTQRLELFGQRAELCHRADPARARAALDQAEERVREDKGLRRGKHQLNYLGAERNLLLALIQEDCYDRTQRTLKRLAQVAAEVRTEVEAWRLAVKEANRQLVGAVEAVDKERRAAEGFPLRRIVPRVGDRDTEEWLYTHYAGVPDPERGRSGLAPVAEALRWRVSTEGGRPVLALRGGTRVAGPGLVDALVDGLRSRARPVFAPLRERSVFEILEHSGESGEALGRELLDGSDWLVSYDDEEHRRLVNLDQDDDGEAQQQVYAFAALPASGAPGAALSRSLWTFLGEQRVDLNDIVPSNESEERPATDKIMLFASRHSLRLGAFAGFSDLRRSYHQRRGGYPSPHVLAEEKTAAALEAKADELYGEGVIREKFGPLTGRALLLCRKADLLRATAIALANERLVPTYHPHHPDQVTGWSVRSYRGGPDQELGDKANLGQVLRDLTLSGTKLASTRIGAVRSAAQEVIDDGQDWEYGTRRFYGLPPAYPLEPGLWQMLTVAAYLRIDEQRRR